MVEASKRHNRGVLAIGLQFFGNGLAYASIIPRLPEIRQQMDITTSALGLMLTVASLGGLVGSAVVSRLLNRLSSRVLIFFGTALLLLSVIAVAGARSPWVFVVALASFHFADLVVDVCMNLQGAWLSGMRQFPIMNRLHGLWSVGTVLGGLIAVWSTSAGVGLLPHVLMVAVLLAVALAAVSRFVLHAHEMTKPKDGQTTRSTSPTGPMTTFTRSAALVFAILGSAAVVLELAASEWAGFRLSDDLDISSSLVGLGYVAFTGGMVVGRFGGDFAEKRLGTQRMVRYGSLIAATGMIVALLMPLEAAPAGLVLPLTLTGYFVAALGTSVIFPQLYNAAANAAGKPGQALGAMTAGTRIASIVTPVSIGVLADTTLSVGASTALTTLPACVLLYFMRPAHDTADTLNE